MRKYFYCTCGHKSELTAADAKNTKKACPNCQKVSKPIPYSELWPTSGYSYNVPSVNKSARNPNAVSTYPKGTMKRDPSAPIPAPQVEY